MIQMRTIPMVTATLALLVPIACERSPDQASSPSTATAQATPVLDAYATLWARLDSEKLVLTGHVKPISAALEFDEMAPPGERERLLAFLAEAGPVLDEVCDLSKSEPEVFPPMPSLEEIGSSDAHMRHPKAWFQNFARLLSADACVWAASGDQGKTMQRLAAMMRLGASLCRQPADLGRLTGAGIIGQAARRATAMIDAGLLPAIPPASLEGFRVAVDDAASCTMTEAPDLAATVSSALQELRDRLDRLR